MRNRIIMLIGLFFLSFFNLGFSADDSVSKNFDKLKEPSIEELEAIDKYATSAPLFIKDYSLTAIRNIGRIVKEETKKSPNLHDQKKINIEKTFYFDGLEIAGMIVVDKLVGEEKGSDEVLLNSITVTGPQWKILNGLEVGSPTKKVIEALGKRYEDVNGAIKYSGTTEEIQFFTKQDKIEKIYFIYYLD